MGPTIVAGDRLPDDETARPATPTDGKDNRPSPPRESWWLWNVGGLLLLLLGSIWLFPAVGVPLLALTVLAVVPLGTLLEDRVAILLVLLAFSSATCFYLLELPVSEVAVQWGCSFVVLGMFLSVAVGGRRPSFPALKGSSLCVLFAIAVGLFLMFGPFSGQEPGPAISGLIAGWDHSSHFSFFSSIYDQETTNTLGRDGEPSFGASYPGVHTALWAALAQIFVAGSSSGTSLPLVVPYVFFSSLTAALCLGALAAVSANVARLATKGRASAAGGAAGALVAGVALVVGGGTQFQTLGHVNYLLAVTVAVCGSWYSVTLSAAGRRFLPYAVAVAATVATLVSYPPVVATMLPALLWMVWHLYRAHPVVALITGAVGAGFLMFGLFRLGAGPGDLIDSIDQIVLYPGGLQSFSAMIIIAAPFAVVVLSRHAAMKPQPGAIIAVAGPLVGLTSVAGLFSWRTFVAGGNLAEHYYATKLWLGVWLIAVTLISALIAIWFGNYLARNTHPADSLRGPWRWAAWLALGATAVASQGYVGPNSESLPPGTPLSAALSDWLGRQTHIATLPYGQWVASAATRTTDIDAQPLLWDGGDAKTNTWLLALRGTVAASDRATYANLFEHPYGTETVQALEDLLGTDPEKRIAIGYVGDASRKLLEPLKKSYPNQVDLVRIG